MTVTPLFHFSSSFAVMLHTSTFIALLVSLTILPSGIAAASIAKAAERMSAAGDEISEGEALKLLQAVTALDAYYRHRADASNNNKQQLQQPFIIPTVRSQNCQRNVNIVGKTNTQVLLTNLTSFKSTKSFKKFNIAEM